MRSEYLFDLAFHCNIPPAQVDDMRILDFARFVKGIDEVRAHIEKQNRANSGN